MSSLSQRSTLIRSPKSSTLKDFYKEMRPSIALYFALTLISCLLVFGLFLSKYSTSLSTKTASISSTPYLTMEDEGEDKGTDDGKNKEKEPNVSLMGGQFGLILNSVADTLNISIDPAVFLSICAGTSILEENGIWLENLPHVSFGLTKSWAVRIFAFTWLVLSVVFTLIGGKMEEISSKYLGPCCLFITCTLIAISSIQSNTYLTNSISHASLLSVTASGVLMTSLHFVTMIAMYVAYMFIRVMIFGLDAVISIVSKFAPGLKSILTLVKSALVPGIYALRNSHPVLLCLLFLALLIPSILVFRWAFNAIRYFKRMHLRPFFRKVFHSGEITPLVDPKAPKAIKACLDQNTLVLIPVFPTEKTKAYPFHVRELWWLASSGDKVTLYRQPFFKKDPEVVSLYENGYYNPAFLAPFGTASKEIFLRKTGILKGSRLEIFSVGDMSKNPSASNRVMRFVISREYLPHYEYLQQVLHFRDYDQVKDQIRQGR